MHIKYLIFANSKYQEMQSWYLSDFFDFDFIYINIYLHIHMNSLPGEHKQECKIHEKWSYKVWKPSCCSWNCSNRNPLQNQKVLLTSKPFR